MFFEDICATSLSDWFKTLKTEGKKPLKNCATSKLLIYNESKKQRNLAQLAAQLDQKTDKALILYIFL